MSDSDDLDLAALPDDELVTQMHEDLYDGLAPEIAEGTIDRKSTRLNSSHT